MAAFIGEHEPSVWYMATAVMRSVISFGWRLRPQSRLLFKRNICHQAIFYRHELFSTIGPYSLRYRVWPTGLCRCFSNPALVCYMRVVVLNYNEFGGLQPA